MIEKLKEHEIVDPKTNKVIAMIGCDLHEVMDKVNELVDTVNNLQTTNTHIQNDLYEMRHPNTKTRVENVQDKYAEQDEIWKDIKGYENQYQISNLGNIRALSRKGQRKGVERMETRISNWGYPIISIWKNNKQKTFSVHRLVAETFIANPNNKAEVNHKNGIKTDNRVENLEWVTREENIQHAYNTGLNPRSLPMPEVVKMPKIICCETGDVFNSITEASHKYNVSISHLSSCLNGKDNRKTVGGWHWLYCYCQPVKPDDDIIYKGE